MALTGTPPSELKPALDIDFSNWPTLHDFLTTASNNGITLFQGAAALATAAIEGAAGSRVLRLVHDGATNDTFDGSARDAPIFKIDSPLATEQNYMFRSGLIEVLFDTDGLDVFGADEAFFFGTHSNLSGIPGDTNSAALFVRAGGDNVGTSRYELATLLGGTMIAISSGAGTTLAHDLAFQWDQLATVGWRLEAALRRNTIRGNITVGRSPHESSPVLASLGIGVFFGLTAQATPADVSISRIRVYTDMVGTRE